MYTEKPWSLYEYLVISLTNAIVEITNATPQNQNREALRRGGNSIDGVNTFFAVARIEDGTYKKTRVCVQIGEKWNGSTHRTLSL